MSDQSPQGDRLLLVAFGLSGCAALGYEVLWTRLLSLGLGSETLGVLGVLAGFFAGMALGAWVLHDRVRRSADPLALFVRLELIAAAFAVASPWMLHALMDTLAATGDSVTGPGIVRAILIGGALLLPGSFCLGATFAALAEDQRRRHAGEPSGRGLARLYAANTIGATAGVLLTVHVVLPAVGMGVGAAVLAACGVAAVVVARRYRALAGPAPSPTQTTEAPKIDTSRDPDPDVGNEPWLPHLMLLGTGLVGVGLEVVGVRVLSQVLENTIYTFADVLAVYLLGTAIGAWIYGRFATRAVAGRPATVAAGLLITVAISVVGSAVAMGQAQAILERVAGDGAGYGAHLLAEAVLAALVFGLPTVVMGAVFSHFVGLVGAHGVGRAYALNTLGSAAAPLVFGVWAIGSFGYTDALYVVVYSYLGLFGLFTWVRRFKPAVQLGAILGVIALTTQGPKSLVLVGNDEGWQTVSQHETLLGLVRVSEQTGSDPPLRRLQVDKQFRMGGAKAVGERRMGHLPLLLAPQAERVLFLGVGTGATAGAALSYPTIAHIDAVELVPAVLTELHQFQAINGNLHEASRVHLHAADARRFVTAATTQWDVVVADLFHPARDGAGNLYSREHFAHVAAHLTDDGLFAQWLPMYQLDPESLTMVIRTFCDVFGEVHSFLGIYNVENPALVLIGRDPARASGPLTVDHVALQRRLSEAVYAEVLMSDASDLLAGYMLDRDTLLALAGPGPLSTDLHPRVSFTTPRGAYVDDSRRGPNNLRAILASRQGPPDTFIVGPEDNALASFVAERDAVAQALGEYLEGEFTRLGDPHGEAMSMAAVGHFISAHRTAPQFVAARGMLYLAAQQGREQAEAIYPALVEIDADDPRPYRAYLQYLRSIGDQTRFDAVLAVAQQRFPPAAAPSAVATPPASQQPPPMLRP